MKAQAITPLLLGLLVCAACPSDPGSPGNPATLWLAPDMVETRVKLVGKEPDPF